MCANCGSLQKYLEQCSICGEKAITRQEKKEQQKQEKDNESRSSGTND